MSALMPAADVASVRGISDLARAGAQERLHRYPTEVLKAAIAAESKAPDCRILFIELLGAEIERRFRETV